MEENKFGVVEFVMQETGKTEEEARKFLKELKKKKEQSSISRKYYFPLVGHGWFGEDSDGYEDYGDCEEGNELDGFQLREYYYPIRKKIEEESCDIAKYYDGSYNVEKAEWGIEYCCGVLMGYVYTVLSEEFQSREEEERYIEWIAGQNSDGFGEGFEQTEIYKNGRYGRGRDYIYVSMWNDSDEYFVCREEDVAKQEYVKRMVRQYPIQD